MSIPSNISKAHLLNAISKITQEGIPNDAASKYYDMIYNGERFPPKLVVSYANIFANGIELDRNSFRGGKNTECFDLLESNGFEIVEKYNQMIHTSYFEELMKFVVQSKTDSLTTSNYTKFYKNLRVRVSFGQGNAARISWIAFLNQFDEVQHGIYPVYLFFKSKNLLILAYGVSETNKPRRSWNLEKGITIKDYFSNENQGLPERYGSSFVYKVYNTLRPLEQREIDQDLNHIIDIYQKMSSQEPELKFLTAFFDKIKKSGLSYSNPLILRFTASLLTKPFVILTGLSGSGKTKLAQAFVHWICQDESQYCLVPVGADWTNREPLLGYPNALKPEEYVKPDSGVLDLIIRANQHPELPHFLILDEMNLSHVERYFADFLSVMESKDEIPLYSDGNVNNGVPPKLTVPSNLFIIGTVNIDETTNMFSPKVLDRANTIEFRVTQDEMKSFLGNIRDIGMDELKGKGASMAKNFLEMAGSRDFASADSDKIQAELIRFFGELKKTGAEFGYRSASEILRLIHHLSVLDNTLTTEQKLDIAIMQKLLPKLHGSRRKLCPILETLGSFCVSGDVKIIKEVFENQDFDYNDMNVLYPLSLEKISRMYHGAIDNGFASFAEA